MPEADYESIITAVAAAGALRAQAAQMWFRIAAAIEREAAAAPAGEDRELAEEWSRQIRRRLRPRAVR